MSTTDQQLLERFAENGCEDSFGAIVNRHLRTVYGAAFRRTSDRELAEEIAQNVFTILARKAPALKEHPTLSGWLHLTAVRECSRAHRSRQRRQKRMQTYQEIVDTDLEAGGDSAWDEISPFLDEAIATLRPKDRDLVVLHFMEGLSYREIGERLDRTTAAIQKQASRAVAKLAAILTKRGTYVSTSALLSGATSIASTAAPPATFATTVASTAIQSAPQLGTLALATHTLATMTYAKTKIAAAAALIAILPLGLEWRNRKEVGTLEEENKGLRHQLENRAAAPKPTSPAAAGVASDTPAPNQRRRLADLQERVLSASQKLADGRLSLEEYRLNLQRIGAELTAVELVGLMGELNAQEPPIKHVDRLLFGAVKAHPSEVFAIAKESGWLSKKSMYASQDYLQLSGWLYWHLTAAGNPSAEIVLEESEEAAAVQRTAMRAMLAEVGIEAAVAGLVNGESFLAGLNKSTAVSVLTKEVAKSGIDPTENLAREVLGNLDALGVSSVRAPVKSMTQLDRRRGQAFVEDLPHGQTRSLAANAFFDTLAREDSDKALAILENFPATDGEHINILLGLQCAFLANGEDELAKQCADGLIARGATP